MHNIASTKLPAAGSLDPILLIVRAWVQVHSADILHAALLLGGAAAHRKCLRFLDSLRGARALSTRHLRELGDLHRLLTLENVGDPDRHESGHFAEIDPSDPFVGDICFLADSLFHLLRRIRRIRRLRSQKTPVAAQPPADQKAA